MRGRLDIGPSTGFTLIELVVVLVIVGVLAVTALPKFFDRSAFESRGFHDETLGFLRYAQKTAVAQRRQVCVAFTAGNASLTIASVSGSSSCDTSVAGPTGQTLFQVSAPSGVLYSAFPSSFSFDTLGRVAAQKTIQVSGVSQAITVEAETGYVHP